MAFLSFAEFLKGEHVDRTKIIESLPQVVSLAAGRFEDEIFVRFDLGDKAGERNIQFLHTVFARVFKLGDGLSLTDLDRRALVTCLAGTAIKVGKVFAHPVGT